MMPSSRISRIRLFSAGLLKNAVTSTGASDFINITFTGTVVSTTDPINFPTQLALLGETGVDLGNGMAVNGRFVTPVAEPISMTMIGAGLAGLAAVRRRRRSV